MRVHANDNSSYYTTWYNPTWLEVTVDGVEAVDLGSTNGILVDGSKVGRARLHDGSTIKIGHTEMTVRIDGGRDEAGGWNV